MAKSKIDPRKKDFIKELIELYHPKSAKDAGDALKDLLGPVIQDIYGFDVSAELVRNVTDKIMDRIM